MTALLSAHEIEVLLPAGWEGEIYRRPDGNGSTSFPVMHLTNFPLPAVRGDFGSGVVELMEPSSVFISLFEYGPQSVGKALFSRNSFPRAVTGEDFHPNRLHRIISGQLGFQRFLEESARAFCLYIVVGGRAKFGGLLGEINRVLPSISIATTRPV